ncbi:MULTISPECIES: hypothetical protein [unclassified Streptomyces]|uniref:hypothetical protein n=1 Tax=unclassified Streptomyces TaxID=2593676 RepID=UPI002252A929|nr:MULTISPECIES: hypothetical protein [unclassified Streptomyces]MCX4991636.1 hypothetical protein [Streptomyces sp. NBC_00568]MCX5003128.1 hypothetical protein [Streptomyces sp. NBC_00638]
MGIRTLHRRTAMATTVVVATVTVTAAVVPALFAPVPAIAAEAGTAQLPAVTRSPHERDRTARTSRGLRAALSARLGAPSGILRGPKARIEDGGQPRAAHGRRVHGTGAFTGPARTYRIVVLSYDNPKTAHSKTVHPKTAHPRTAHPAAAHGIRAIERIARAVHRGLSRGRGLLLGPGSPSGA